MPRFTSKRTVRTEPVQKKDIEDTITTIYQDANGRVPNMKHMTIRRTNPVLKFFSSLFIVGIVGALLTWGGFLLLPKNGASDTVVLAFDGPESVTLGATTTYQLTYGNNQTITLKKITLNIYYPEGFVFLGSSVDPSNQGHNEWKLADLSPNETHAITITGKYYGPLQKQKSWRAFFNYTPSNFNSELQKIATKNITVDHSPFILNITGPDTVNVGADAIYTFKVDTASNDQPTLWLVPMLPTNFQLASSSPRLDKNNRWNVSFASSTSALFSLKGKFKNSDTATSGIRAALFVATPGGQLNILAETEMKPALEQNDVASSFTTAINDIGDDQTLSPGDTMAIAINFKNTGSTEIKNGNLVLSFEAPSVKKQSSLAWGQIEDAHNGDIVGDQLSDTIRRGVITWSSKRLPALTSIKPGDTVTLNLKLPIKNTDDFNFAASKETAIRINTTLVSKDSSGASKTLTSNPITITLGSDLALKNKDTVTTNSSGKDEHTISWTLTNHFHNLKNLILTATAYGDVTYLPGSAGSGTISYSPTDKKITWAIPSITNNGDALTGTFILVINTKNPTQNTLLSKVSLQADDTDSGQTITLTGNAINLK